MRKVAGYKEIPEDMPVRAADKNLKVGLYMKIMHLLQSNRFSGAENVVCQIINMFKNTDEIEMIYCSRDGQIREALLERDVTFVPIKDLTVKEVKRVIENQKPDIIHAHDCRAGLIAVNSTKKIPIISHLHHNPPWLKRCGIKSLLYGVTCKKCATILTVSDSIFDEFVFGSKYRNKLNVVGNPININEICSKADVGEIEAKYDIGYCGRLTYPKNPMVFLDIVSIIKNYIPDIKSAMIGDGELRENIKHEIRLRNLNENIVLYGFQSNPYKIMKQFKIIVMPSLYEGFGLVALEAMSLGVPVVCSGVGGLCDFVNDSCGKICTDTEDYVEEILKLLSDTEYLKEKSKSARKQSIDMDNIPQYRLRLFEVYKFLKEH